MKSSKLAVLVVAFAVFLVLLVYGIAEVRAARATASWPTAPGIITVSDASRNEDCVEFTYSVGGVAHAGRAIHLHDEQIKEDGRSPSCQLGVVQKYAAGRQVQVRYDPADPANAILEPGLAGSGSFILLVIAFYAVLLCWLLVRELSERGQQRRRLAALSSVAAVGSARAAQAIGELLAIREVTPAEIVAINGAQFAARSMGSDITLLDGMTRVSARQLFEAEMKAAFVAHEAAGNIRLEISASPSANLYIVPTHVPPAWPAPSIESRFDFPAREEASAVVLRWLAKAGNDTWTRAAEKAYIPMVLRGCVSVGQVGLKRKYRVSDPAVMAAASRGLPAISDLLQRFEVERGDVANLLTKAIETAVATPTPWKLTDAFKAADPWTDEAEDDVRAVPGLALRGIAAVPRGATNAAAGLLWIALALVVFNSRLFSSLVGLGGLVLTSALIAAYGKWGDGIVRQSAPRWPVIRPVARVASAAQGSKQVALPLGALFALFLADSNHPFLAAVAFAGAVVAGGMWLLKEKTALAIAEQVSGGPPRAVSRADVKRDAPPLTPPAAAAPSVPPQFEVEVVRAQDLPPVSESSGEQLRAVRERGPRIRKLYRRSTILLAAAATGVSVIWWWLISASDPREFPWGTFYAFFLTLFLLGGLGRAKNSDGETSGAGGLAILFVIRAVWRYLRGGAGAERNRWELQVTPIRPLLAPLLGLAWLAILAFRGLSYLDDANPLKWIPVATSGGAFIAYVVLMRRSRWALEAKYPVFPPLSLLVLRVFDSTSRAHFVDLLDLWHWFGPLYRLDGPDTAGGKTADVVAFLGGHLERAITENGDELENALRGFSQGRDAQLRFPINSVQCNDAVWKIALQKMLDRSDVVVMDLSGFTERNRGSAYELGTLLTGKPRERVLLLINDETDMNCLRSVLAEAAGPGNPQNPPRSWRVFHLGTQSARKHDESLSDWQRRSEVPIDGDRLVGLLRDAACTGRPHEEPQVVRWTRPAYGVL